MKMSKNLSDYLKIYKVISDESCDKIIQELEKEIWKKHEYYDVTTNKSNIVNAEKELDVLSTKNIDVKNFVEKQIYNTIYQYVIKDLNFNFMLGWQNFSDVRFNRYSVGQIMSEHCDHIHSLFEGKDKGIPILSILGCLNDDYEGGQFLMWGDEEIKISKGEIAIFPSNFLYPHQVLPITKGVRYSFVSWAW